MSTTPPPPWGTNAPQCAQSCMPIIWYTPCGQLSLAYSSYYCCLEGQRCSSSDISFVISSANSADFCHGFGTLPSSSVSCSSFPTGLDASTTTSSTTAIPSSASRATGNIASITRTTTSLPTSTPPPNNTSLSTGAKVGIGLGVAAVVLLAIIATSLFWSKFVKRGARGTAISNEHPQGFQVTDKAELDGGRNGNSEKIPLDTNAGEGGFPVHEIASSEGRRYQQPMMERTELGAGHPRSELPT